MTMPCEVHVTAYLVNGTKVSLLLPPRNDDQGLSSCSTIREISALKILVNSAKQRCVSESDDSFTKVSFGVNLKYKFVWLMTIFKLSNTLGKSSILEEKCLITKRKLSDLLKTLLWQSTN